MHNTSWVSFGRGGGGGSKDSSPPPPPPPPPPHPPPPPPPPPTSQMQPGRAAAIPAAYIVCQYTPYMVCCYDLSRVPQDDSCESIQQSLMSLVEAVETATKRVVEQRKSLHVCNSPTNILGKGLVKISSYRLVPDGKHCISVASFPCHFSSLIPMPFQ